jgi:phage-related protein
MPVTCCNWVNERFSSNQSNGLSNSVDLYRLNNNVVVTLSRSLGGFLQFVACSKSVVVRRRTQTLSLKLRCQYWKYHSGRILASINSTYTNAFNWSSKGSIFSRIILELWGPNMPNCLVGIEFKPPGHSQKGTRREVIDLSILEIHTDIDQKDLWISHLHWFKGRLLQSQRFFGMYSFVFLTYRRWG